MPNWIKGSLKLRGSYDNIMRFFEEGLNVYNKKDELIPKEDWLDIHEYDRCTDIMLNNESFNYIYIEGTKQAFLCDDWNIITIDRRESEDQVAVLIVQQAWDFRTDEWKAISNKYDLDVRLYGFESNMQFGHKIDICRGKIPDEEYLKYVDWNWDCPFPWVGG